MPAAILVICPLNSPCTTPGLIVVGSPTSCGCTGPGLATRFFISPVELTETDTTGQVMAPPETVPRTSAFTDVLFTPVGYAETLSRVGHLETVQPLFITLTARLVTAAGFIPAEVRVMPLP